jgi:hypothetical protein
MNESGVEAELTGADAVRQWFGSWPNFHDAEVISLSLARKGLSVLVRGLADGVGSAEPRRDLLASSPCVVRGCVPFCHGRRLHCQLA